MQISKIERSLNKISSMVELLKMDGKLSNIEKDLLKDYVRKLYDQISEEGDTEDIQVEKQTYKTSESPKTKPAIKEVETQPLVVEKAEIIPIDSIVEQSKKAEDDKERVSEVSVKGSSKFDELFLVDEVTDLSGRLSMTKIDDINKAIGINERMFTIRELFDGDNSKYDQTIKALNGKSDFNEAKSYLSNEVITKFDWNSDEKIKKAQYFIKIVRRLFA